MHSGYPNPADDHLREATMQEREEIKKTIEETFDANEFELLEFLNNARAFEEYLEQLEGAISEGNQLYHATWKGLSILIEILEELQSDQ
jgi:hypothetical protein